MSDYTVVEKKQLQLFKGYMLWSGSFFGAFVATSLLGFLTGTVEAYFLSILNLLSVIGVWYVFRDDFSNIRQAIEEAEGDGQ